MVEGLGCLGAALLVLLAFRFSIMGSQPPEFAPADNPAADCDSIGVRALTFLFLPAFNAWLLLCPATLSFDWSMEAVPLVSSLADARNLASLGLYAALAALLGWVLLRGRAPPRRRPSCGDETPQKGLVVSSSGVEVVVMALALLVLPFLPATNLFFYVGFVVAERILYIPSMGSCLLVGWGAHVLHSRARSQGARRALWLAVLALFVLFSARTWRRNCDWTTEENLYRSGIPINPPKGEFPPLQIVSANGAAAEW